MITVSTGLIYSKLGLHIISRYIHDIRCVSILKKLQYNCQYIESEVSIHMICTKTYIFWLYNSPKIWFVTFLLVLLSILSNYPQLWSDNVSIIHIVHWLNWSMIYIIPVQWINIEPYRKYNKSSKPFSSSDSLAQ